MPQAIINSYLGGPTFFPTDIPGLIRWYDAGSFADSGYVDLDPIMIPWDDKSSSAEDAIPDAGNEPLFRNTILPNGKVSVQFTDGFKHFDTTEMTLGNYSVVAFWRPIGDSIICSSPSGNYQVREIAPTTVVDHPSLFNNDGVTLDFIGTGPGNVWHVRTWTRNGVTGVPFFYLNKLQEAEKDGQTSVSNMKISTIGLFNGGPGDNHLAELLIYNAVLTQTNVDNLHDSYFSLKYPGVL